MKRTFKFLFAGAFAVVFASVALTSCNDKEEEHDDAYYASQASVTSSDAGFTANNNGGEIHFKAEGGSVTLSVNCGTEWTADNTASDLFSTSVSSATLTVTAWENPDEEERTGIITLRTASKGISFATITVTQSAFGAPEISVEVSEWNFPAVGILTAEIAVEASADWTAEAADAWLTVTQTGTGISLTATENEDTEVRSTLVTLTCTDGSKSSSEYVTVTQDGVAYITLSDYSLTLSADGETATVTVQSNFDWYCSSNSSDGWVTVGGEGDTMTVSATANEGDSRTATVTVTAGDGAENVTEVQLTVSQENDEVMILTYTITSANRSTTLPLFRSPNCTVDWGDGSAVQTVTKEWPTHTYAEAGKYDIKIKGTMTALFSGQLSLENDPLPITAVKQWGRTGLNDMQYAFYCCSLLESLPEHTGDAFAEVTNFDCAFYYCASLEEIPDDLFANCPKVTDSSWMFYDCPSLKRIPKGIFDNIPLTTTFQSTFYNCTSLEEIPEGLFDKCPLVTDFSYVFYGCESVKTIPAGLFDACPSVKNFCCVFYSCPGIEEIPAGLFDKCTEVTDFSYGFHACSSLKAIPSGLFDSCTKVENFRNIFYKCTSLVTVPTDLFSKNLNVTNFRVAFSNDSAVSGESPYNEIVVNGQTVKVHLYERGDYASELGCATITDGTNCFEDTTFSDIDSIPSDWGGKGK